MSSWGKETDKLHAYLEDLVRRHKELDTEIKVKYNNITASDEVRKMKTMKLWLKDEIYRTTQQLERIGAE